ncbi:MAG: tyrosine-type recombinase/integrase [Desulfamplus sp.]|nr:tyrosine-type recombinase/integrase [Desulfamplus sp.]
MATIYKRGKFWWVSYKDRTGRRISKSTKLTDKTSANVIKKHYDTVEKSYSFTGTPLQHSIKFSDWFNEYMQLRENRLSEKTLINDKLAYNSLKSYLKNDKYLNDIKEGDVENWYNYLLKNNSVATANSYLRHIKSCFNTAVKKEYLIKSVCNIKHAKETINKITSLTQEEVKKLLSIMPIGWQNLVKVALFTGARAGEICRLKKKDVDLNQQTITIASTPNDPTKSKKFRVVPLPDHSISFFQQLINSHQKQNLLVNAKNEQWRVDWITHGFTRYAKKAGIDCTFHDLRRTYGAWLVMNGVDLVTIQENLGHSDISVTRNHYIHLMIDHKKEQVNKLPVIM